MKNILLLPLLLFYGLPLVNAQVGYTRSDITARFGTAYYKTGTSAIGEPYVIYKTQDSTAASGIFIKTMGFYFKKSDDGTEYCNEQLIMEPLSELQKWVEYYKSKYKQISKKEFKDETNKIIFRVSIIDNQCAVRIWAE
ncbi:MAG: hypothetical protein HY063_04185 [Bacteroidetes bacterium]|nr:hypothetical protein [Bacteroidota bacterium]